jgi:hypothetical protein
VHSNFKAALLVLATYGFLGGLIIPSPHSNTSVAELFGIAGVIGVKREIAMKCLCCGRPIEPRYAWRGCNGRFYCSGFCADSGDGFSSTSPEPVDTRNSEFTREEAA